MIAAANAYFDMFFDPQGTVVPFATPCDRWENGTRTTQGDCANMGPAGAGAMSGASRPMHRSSLRLTPRSKPMVAACFA
jgi:hypothetical protein